MRRGVTCAIAIAALLAPLAACATDTADPPAGVPRPSLSIPANDPPLVTTPGPVTVIDDGDGTELCLGMVLESLPPQCGGPALVGWDWEAREGYYEEANGVTWGLYEVDGYYDPDTATFDLVEARAGDTGGDAPGASDALGTPCEAPAGGWHVGDGSRVSESDQFAALELATTLDGYAGSWVDLSRNPATTHDPEEFEDPLDWELAMSDPRHTIINVKVTGDAKAAERVLRTAWSGMLCVSTGEHTQKELLRIQDQLTHTPGLLGSAANGIRGVVEVQVTFDDGSLQAQLDARYGDGLIEVTSALIPAGS